MAYKSLFLRFRVFEHIVVIFNVIIRHFIFHFKYGAAL